jgi:hypothetical protein
MEWEKNPDDSKDQPKHSNSDSVRLVACASHEFARNTKDCD